MRDASGPTPTYAEHAWLAAVLPVDGRRFRVVDAALASTLVYAGAELVEDAPDVEIAPPDQLVAEAPFVVATINGTVANVPSRVRQVAGRVARSTQARVRAERTRRELRRRGYADVRVIPWDVEHALRLPGHGPAVRLQPAERLPRRALVVARRDARSPTPLDVAHAAAAAASGDRSALAWPLMRAGSLVAIGAETVLRVAVGPGREHIDRQAEVLSTLAAGLAGDPRAALVPPLIAAGDAGLARWSVERRLAGSPAPARIPAPLLADCLDFLDALERCGGDGDALTATARAETLARLLPRHAPQLHALGAELDAATASVPRVFGHGDFWSNNLLVTDGRLSGVVDWEAAGAGRLPLLDLFQLTIVERMGGDPYGWGRAVVEHLLPACRAGGDELTRAYLRRTGRAFDAATLEALALAYWLDRATSQITAHVGRLRDAAWIEANVERVLSALEPRRAPAAAVDGGRRRPVTDVLVLCYHAVSERWPAELAVTPGALEAQLRALLERGYRTVTFSEAVAAPAPSRALAITFDDGYRSVLEAAFPVLERLGAVATVFVCTDFVDSGGQMTWDGISQWTDGPHGAELMPLSWDDLATLRAAGWEVGSHTRSHPFLTAIDDEALDAELRLSRARCGEALGDECRSLAYPYGDYDERVVAAAASAGYSAACVLPPRPTAPLPLSWPRVGIYRGDGAVAFRFKTSRSLRRFRATRAGAGLDGVYRAWARRRRAVEAPPAAGAPDGRRNAR